MRFKTCSYKSINILEKYSFVPISIEANPPKSYTHCLNWLPYPSL